jgi:hypothetical protein
MRSVALMQARADAMKVLVGAPEPDQRRQCGRRLALAMMAYSWLDRQVEPEGISEDLALRVLNDQAAQALKAMAMAAAEEPAYWEEARQWTLAHPIKIPDQEDSG